MNRQDFRSKYSSVASALGSHFHDGSAHEDEKIAQEIRSDLPQESRVRLITKMLADANRLLPNLDDCWQLMAEEANRQIESANDAREWLSRIIAVWQDELDRIQNNPR